MVDTALFSRAERKAEDLAGRQAGKADLRLLFELLQIVLTDLGVEDVPVDEHRSALMPFLKDRTPAPMGEVHEPDGHRVGDEDGDEERAEQAAHRDRPGLDDLGHIGDRLHRSEEHTSELQSIMRISYAVSCLKKKK